MKTSFQNMFMPRLLSVVLFFSFSSAFGQELIRGTVDYYLCDTSIIREVGKDSVLIYNHRYTSTFMIVTSSEPNPPTVYFDSIFVKDFEVHNKIVSFCGSILQPNGNKNGVFGFFNIDSFPNPTITYYVLDGCKALNKLDIYEIVFMISQKEKHLVMTGTTGTRSDVLVDATTLSTLVADCHVYFSQDENENLDDVAVTDNRVIVSTRYKYSGNPVMEFWQYARPTSLGQNIFLTSVNKFTASTPVPATPVFLEHRTANEYAAVCKVNGYSRIATLLLEASTPNYSSVEITGIPLSSIYPMDIKYNWKNKVYDILARGEVHDNRQYETRMQIYHITPDVINNIALNGDGTWYPYHLIWSIDPVVKIAAQFVASSGLSELARYHRYKHDQWNACPEHFEYKYDIGKFEGKIEDEYLPTIEPILLEPKERKFMFRPIPFPVYCGEN